VPLDRLCVRQTCAEPTPSPGIRVADNPLQADRLWNACRGRLILGGSADAGKRPVVDFAYERLIYIHMGARRTGGFHLNLAGDNAEVVDRTLVIPVIWEVPSKGAMVPQVLTHPCLLLAAPRGAYSRIAVVDVDRDGQTLLSTPLPLSTP
jgi:hypothetical protein